MTPREIYGIEFQYHHDFDQNGILYYLGTNGGTEPFENPALTGRVKVIFISSTSFFLFLFLFFIMNILF